MADSPNKYWNAKTIGIGWSDDINRTTTNWIQDWILDLCFFFVIVPVTALIGMLQSSYEHEPLASV